MKPEVYKDREGKALTHTVVLHDITVELIEKRFQSIRDYRNDIPHNNVLDHE